MRKFVLNETHRFILRRISEGASISQISRIMKVRHSNVVSHIKRLTENGYVIAVSKGKRRKEYYLTSRGIAEISKSDNFTNAHAKSDNSNKKQIKELLKNNSIQRKHFFSVNVPIFHAPKWWKDNYENKTRLLLEKKETPYQIKQLNGWKQYTFFHNSTRIKTTPKSIIFVTPDIYENDTGEALRESWKYLESAMLYVENLFGIRLNRAERTIRIVTNEHTAFVNCPVAKFLAEMGHKRFTIYNPENKKIEYAWDESIKGFKESEFFGSDQDTHIENFKHEFGALYRGEVSIIENKQAIGELINLSKKFSDSIINVAQSQQTTTQSISEFVKLAKNLTTSIESITNSINLLTHVQKQLEERLNNEKVESAKRAIEHLLYGINA